MNASTYTSRMSSPLSAHEIEGLYARYSPIIYARSRRYLDSRSAAEDATQDIFVKLLDRAGALPPTTDLLPWLLRITTNHCLNILRDARRHAAPVEELPESVDTDFEDALVARDFAEAVLAATPETLATPARLYHAEGINQSTVAEMLGVSRRTIVTRLSLFAKHVLGFQQSAEAW